MNREDYLAILKKYNTEPFHIRHALTVEGVMRYFAEKRWHDPEYWGIVWLLHDLDYGMYPSEHCVKSQEIMREEWIGEDIIKSTASHGYWLTEANIEPEHEMEKVLFAVDELTWLVWAVALMRPSKSTKDLELKSVKKKFKTPAFAAGCSRDTIIKWAEMMWIELDDLIEETILAMREYEDSINEYMNNY